MFKGSVRMDAGRESKRIQDVVDRTGRAIHVMIDGSRNVQSFIIPGEGGCPGGDDGLIALTREALIDVPLNYITGKIFRWERASAFFAPVRTVLTYV